MHKKLVPQSGDVWLFSFDPAYGHEQKGTRPGIVVTDASYNACSGLCMVVPLTSSVRGYPFEVRTSLSGKAGVALVDQLACKSWVARAVRREGTVSDDVMAEIRGKLAALLEIASSRE